MDFSAIQTNLITAAVVGGVPVIIGFLWKMRLDLHYMKVSGLLRKQENLLIIRAIKIMIRCMKSGKVNGELSDAEKELDNHLQKTAVR